MHHVDQNGIRQTDVAQKFIWEPRVKQESVHQCPKWGCQLSPSSERAQRSVDSHMVRAAVVELHLRAGHHFTRLFGVQPQLYAGPIWQRREVDNVNKRLDLEYIACIKESHRLNYSESIDNEICSKYASWLLLIK